ncbi:MAG TPA: hypothetical protein PK014_07285 [Thermoanaerobaculia bacterium]|nr:hypothetical protein [Thermoanaerobaculia bacterium]HUM29951.1 hypothetical protein [Thermoanaerobaculia bacterium]HXK68182.1 hypothetical protein [Thermoanaerobaculia bacterium]
MRAIRFALLVLGIALMLQSAHSRPFCKASGPLRICIEGPDHVTAGEEMIYRLTFTNISPSAFYDDGMILSPLFLMNQYDPDRFHFDYDGTPDIEDPLGYNLLGFDLGPLDPGESTTVNLEFIYSSFGGGVYEQIDHMDTISLYCNMGNHRPISIQYPISIETPLEDSNIHQDISQPDRVTQGTRVTYTYTIENISEIDFSSSPTNLSLWQIFIPSDFIDPEVMDTTAGSPEIEEVSSDWEDYNTNLRYTFSLQNFAPGDVHQVVFQFTIPYGSIGSNMEEFALMTQFVNENTSADDGVPFIHTFSGFSPLVLHADEP